MSNDLPSAMRIAQVIGITASAFLSGTIAAYSYAVVPVASLAPTELLAQQWQKAFDIGSTTAPPVSLVSTAAFAYLAFKAPSGSQTQYLYAAAALLVPSIVPYTLTAMIDTNNKLKRKAKAYGAGGKKEDVEKADGETVEGLVAKWMVLNAVRAVLPALGAIAGAAAACGVL